MYQEKSAMALPKKFSQRLLVAASVCPANFPRNLRL